MARDELPPIISNQLKEACDNCFENGHCERIKTLIEEHMIKERFKTGASLLQGTRCFFLETWEMQPKSKLVSVERMHEILPASIPVPTDIEYLKRYYAELKKECNQYIDETNFIWTNRLVRDMEATKKGMARLKEKYSGFYDRFIIQRKRVQKFEQQLAKVEELLKPKTREGIVKPGANTEMIK